MRRTITGLALVALLAGCATRDASPPASTGVPPASPTTTTSILPPSPPGGGLALDESLLAILPADVDGVAPEGAPEAFEEARGDPGLAGNVEAIVFFAVPGPEDLVAGSVSRLRPGVWGDAFWRDWRDTFDEGACAQAGGVTGRAEADIGGRLVSITSCAGGLRAYHAFVAERGLIVSLFSLGDGRWGQRIMESLRP